MNIKLNCLITLAEIAWSPCGATIRDIASPRREIDKAIALLVSAPDDTP
jgi:hypothetical protein